MSKPKSNGKLSVFKKCQEVKKGQKVYLAGKKPVLAIGAVSSYYHSFPQVTDEEVIKPMKGANKK